MGTAKTLEVMPADGYESVECEVLNSFPNEQLARSWRECLRHDCYPAHYTAPEFFLDPYVRPLQPFAVVAMCNSRVIGVLTGTRKGSHLCSGLRCRPQICVDKTADMERVVNALAQGFLREVAGAKLLDIYTWYPVDAFLHYGFRCRKEEGVVMLDLSNGPDSLFAQFDKKRRNGIRYAMRQEIEVFEASDSRHLREYYKIHLDWSRRKRRAPVPFDAMESAWRCRENRKLFLASVADRIIAGSWFRFHEGGLVEYAENNSYLDVRTLKPNELLVWHAVQWACQSGFRWFSCGGAHRFLRTFGGTRVFTYRYRWDRTLLRRHDLYESVMTVGRNLLRRTPERFETGVRRLLGKTVPEWERSRGPTVRD